MKSKSFLFFLIPVIITSCNSTDNSSVQTISTTAPADMREQLITQNKKMMLDEVRRIDSWIKHHNIKMESTATGLRIHIIKNGTGKIPRLLSRVTLNYQVNLLDGTYCYSSDSSGALNFIVGQSDEPSGLQEAILQLHEGTEALIIVPSYLAYGLTGDGDRIPGHESLVYKVALIKTSAN